MGPQPWELRKSCMLERIRIMVRFNGAAALGAAEIRWRPAVMTASELASMGPQPWELRKLMLPLGDRGIAGFNGAAALGAAET